MSIELQKSTLRPLGTIEHYFWLSDQNCPKHFVVTAQVRGETTIAAYRSALESVQQRHPLLRAGITLDAAGLPHFTEHGPAPIPLRIVQRDGERTWEQEVARELATPFGLADIPLLRAVVVHAEDVSNIIFSVHHSIGDGLSIAHLIGDMLAALSGRTLKALPISPSQEEVCSRLGIPVSGVALPGAVATPTRADRYIAGSQPTLAVRGLRLSVETTEKLRVRARDEKTTVHGALAAALALAGRQLVAEWYERPIRILSPVNTRKFIGLEFDIIPAVLFPAWAYDLSESPQFWDVARAVTRDLQTVLTPSCIASLFHGFKKLVASATVSEIATFELQACACEILVSNLGALALETSYGRLTLEGMWGPAVLVGNQGEQMVGVTTLHGAIQLLHSSHTPIPLLLETGEQMLLAALR